MKKLLQLLCLSPQCVHMGVGEGGGTEADSCSLIFSIGIIEKFERLHHLPQLQRADWKAFWRSPFPKMDGRKSTVGIKGRVVAQEGVERVRSSPVRLRLVMREGQAVGMGTVGPGGDGELCNIQEHGSNRNVPQEQRCGVERRGNCVEHQEPGLAPDFKSPHFKL